MKTLIKNGKVINVFTKEIEKLNILIEDDKIIGTSVSIDEAYELNDSNCYRIRRMEEDLYKDYAPHGYDCSDVITYQ